ncbi:MAG: hypothetical protein DMG96_42620 [Acidobacteria bacterium]|nr:MAG: hypothetical protein DMG96_42620 [Acidobacteriota bacterium]
MGDESGDSTGPSREEPSRKIKSVNTKRKGELSEAAFLLKAAGLGFGVAKPWGDSERYDFILDSHGLDFHNNDFHNNDAHNNESHGHDSHGNDSHNLDSHNNDSHGRAVGRHLWRVQLKCTEVVRARGYDVQPIYSIYGQGKMVYTADDIDVLVAHIIPLDIWYVLPIEAFAPCKSLRFYPQGGCKRPRFEHYREAWHLLRSDHQQ